MFPMQRLGFEATGITPAMLAQAQASLGCVGARARKRLSAPLHVACVCARALRNLSPSQIHAFVADIAARGMGMALGPVHRVRACRPADSCSLRQNGVDPTAAWRVSAELAGHPQAVHPMALSS
jgi:hypothetical protein